jgi:AraC family transcriptional regulator of arabinose operon
MEKPTTYSTSVGFRCLRNITKQTNDLYLVHCGHQQCPPGYTYDQKIPNENHLHFVLNGKGIITMNGKTYHINKGNIFVIIKGIAINYYADIEDPWEYMWVTFDGEKAADYLAYAGFTFDNPVITSTIPTATYHPMIEKILDANTLTLANEIRRVGYLYDLLSTMIDAQNSTKGERRYDYSNETYIEHALQYISLNYSKNIKVNDIANDIGINRSYFTSIFKKAFHVSPQEYLMNYRFQKAAELIKSTNLSIQDISNLVGYENPYNFSKMFKNFHGASPKNYRVIEGNRK